MRGELKFTSTTRADRFRPRSSEVQFNTLVKVVSWSTYNHETDSFVVRYETLTLQFVFGGGGHQLDDLVLVEAFFM